MNAAPGYEVERLVVTAGRFQLLTYPWRHKVDKTLYLELLRMPLRLNIYVIAAINTSTAMYIVQIPKCNDKQDKVNSADSAFILLII